MRVLHVVPSVAAEKGGTTTAVLGLAASQERQGLSATVTTTADEREAIREAHDVKICAFGYEGGAKWRFSRGFAGFLDRRLGEFDVVHIHGMWQYPQWIASRRAKRDGVPIVLSPHGMLNPWAIAHRRLQKRLYYRLIERGNLRRADRVHAITQVEREAVLRWVPDAQVVVVQHGIDLAHVRSEARMSEESPEPERFVLFLGRIHPVKAIDDLIEAFGIANLGADWRLVIAGPVEVPAYRVRLESLVRRYNLEGRVTFTDPVYGAEKWRLLRRAWVAVVPSHSEVIGMVNLEASACATPSIASTQTGLVDWEQGGGLLFDRESGSRSLVAALRGVAGWTTEERLMRGKKSLDHVAQNYDISIVAAKWRSIYADMIDRRGNVGCTRN